MSEYLETHPDVPVWPVVIRDGKVYVNTDGLLRHMVDLDKATPQTWQRIYTISIAPRAVHLMTARLKSGDSMQIRREMYKLIDRAAQTEYHPETE